MVFFLGTVVGFVIALAIGWAVDQFNLDARLTEWVGKDGGHG